MYIAPPLLKEKLPRLPRPRVANHKSPIAGLTHGAPGSPPPSPHKMDSAPPPPKMDSGAAEQWLARIVVNLNRYILVMALASAWASAWMHQHCAEIFWVVQLVQQSCFLQSIAVVHPPFGGN